MLIPFYFFLSLIKVTISPCDTSDLTACNCHLLKLCRWMKGCKSMIVSGTVLVLQSVYFQTVLKINLPFLSEGKVLDTWVSRKICFININKQIP